MKFNTPCLVCGKLTRGDTRCADHRAEVEARRNSKPDTQARKEKKKILYNSAYHKAAKQIRGFVSRNGATCYLCQDPITPGEPVHVDHVFPELGNASPLAPTHKFCNESKGNKAPQISQ